MESLPPAGRRSTRLTLVALALFALLAIVAFASRSGFGGASRAAPSQTALDYAFTVFFVVFVLAIPVAIYAYYLQQRELAATGEAKRRPFVQTIAIVALFTLIALGIEWMRLHGSHGFLRNVRSPVGTAAQKGLHGKGKAVAAEPHFAWPVLVVFLVLVAAAVAAFVIARRRRKRRVKAVREAPEVRVELAQAISDAIDDLEAEPDARKAVIAAYARMEGVLARHGLPRRPSETPFEYLARVLTDLRARSESVSRLTSLFERAKFSRHAIDLRMKSEAIAALGAIRDDLAGAPA